MPLQPSRMPPIRTADGAGDDKRGTEAGQAVTYTFLNELSPPPVDMESADLSCFTVCDNSPPPTPQRSSHNKRRDASYIPRPPNAFILFRSSFIRDQKVSNKVEGNHSNLSKIIGMYWKALTKEQRDEWEAKAAQALIEHRKRYPDWRFRHAANASANVESRIKVKDGARRGRARKDPPDRGGVVGAEDDVEESPGKGRAAEEASRLTKIAGLLAEGQEGKALERAVEEWEAEQRLTRRSASVSAPESSASADKDPVSGTRSPVVTRVCSSSSMDPDLSPTTYGTPVPSPSLSAPSPIITRASSTEREPSLPYPSTPTPRLPTSASSPSTPRLSLSTSTSASGSLLKLQPASAPSWPASASPVTPQSLASTPSSRSRPPLPWPPSPAPLIRTPGCCSSSSFPAYAPAERWESEHSLARARSKASSSEPVADTLTPDEELSTFMTRASSSEILTTRQCMATSTSASAPNEVLSPPSPRTPLSCTPTPTPTRSPTRAIRIIPSKWPNSPTTPQTSAPWSPSLGVPRVSTSFPTSTYTRTRTETETETDIDTETETKEWQASSSSHTTRLNSTMIKSELSSPVVSRASVSASAMAAAAAVVAGLERAPSSPARVYVSSTPTDLPSASPETSTATSTTTSTTTSTATSTPTPAVPIPKLPPSWPASPSTSTSTSVSAPPAWSLASPLVPCSASASFPAFTRAEDWEFGGGHEFARETSPAVLSSPIMIHASASASTTATRTRNGDPHTPMSSRRPSVSSPLKTMPRTPVSTTSWPASPALDSALALVMSSPIAPRTPGHTASWSNVPSSPAANTPRPPHPHPASDSNPIDSPATPTPTLSRRSRPQSRSPTQRSPQNLNASCVGMKRSLSAPAPKRGHHRQWWQHQHQQEQEQVQVPVRMDEGFWWPVPAPAPHEQGHCRGRGHESAQERENENENENEKGVVEVPMQVHMATPTRDGSFDVFTSHDQETEHEFDLAGGEIDERVWSWSDSDFGYDSKPTSMYSSNPAPVQITPSTTAAPAYQPRFQLEPTPAHERWFNPWDADTTVHAGEYLHPLPPTPISPISTSSIPSPLSPPPFAFSSSTTLAHTPCSSFSSLAGWDGTTSSDHANANANVNSDADADRNAGPGTCAPPKATVAGAAIDGVGWGRGGLQRLGVQGGGYGVDCQWVG